MSGFSITIPYSPYRVTCSDPWDKRGVLAVVSLAKNSQLRTGARHQAVVREAKRQMKEDVGNLCRLASWPEMRPPLTMDAAIYTRTRVTKDDDGAWTGLYPARDAVAEALGINDSEIRTGRATFAVGMPERTVLTMREAGDS